MNGPLRQQSHPRQSNLHCLLMTKLHPQNRFHVFADLRYAYHQKTCAAAKKARKTQNIIVLHSNQNLKCFHLKGHTTFTVLYKIRRAAREKLDAVLKALGSQMLHCIIQIYTSDLEEKKVRRTDHSLIIIISDVYSIDYIQGTYYV